MGTNSDNNLTVEQRSAVNKVRAAADAYRNARDTLERQLREQLQHELSGMLAVRDNDVRVAYALGVKKATLKRALNSKDHATLQNILAASSFVGLPEREMITFMADDTFVVNYVDNNGERVYGHLVCERVLSDGTVTGFEFVVDDVTDPIRVLLDTTTAAGDVSVFKAIVNAVGQ